MNQLQLLNRPIIDNLFYKKYLGIPHQFPTSEVPQLVL